MNLFNWFKGVDIGIRPRHVFEGSDVNLFPFTQSGIQWLQKNIQLFKEPVWSQKERCLKLSSSDSSIRLEAIVRALQSDGLKIKFYGRLEGWNTQFPGDHFSAAKHGTRGQVPSMDDKIVHGAGYAKEKIGVTSQSARDEIDDQFTEPTEPNTPTYQPVETRTTIGRFKWLAICAAVASGLIYYVFSARQSTIAVQAKLDLDKAVSVLPPGTQEAWIGYVDRRVAAAIQQEAGAILVTGLSDESKYVSRNTPYQVSCSPIIGGSIEFGYGDNSITVPIYGVLLDDGKAERPPPLDVANSSFAAANLSRTLCERIAVSLNKILLP